MSNYLNGPWEKRYIWPGGVTVSTADSESGNRGSNLFCCGATMSASLKAVQGKMHHEDAVQSDGAEESRQTAGWQ
eukprot:4422208-Amphidinium_carterae.1